MSTVVNFTLVDATGAPANGAQLQIVCINPNDGAPGRVFHNDGRAIDGLVAVGLATASGNGLISLTLFSQTGTTSPDLVNPANSYYRVQEVGTATTTPYFIQVPEGGGPYNASALLYSPPVSNVTTLHGASSHIGDVLPDGSVQTFGAGSETMAQVTAGSIATPPSGTRARFVDSADGHMKLKTSAGALVDLEAAGSGLTGGVPALTLGTSNAAGVATSGIRTDATVAVFDATVPAAIGTAAAGAATVTARRDHVHPTGAGTPATVGTANATGTGPAASMTDHVHAHEAAHILHDTLWDTAGDLAVGTGADTASKLAITVPGANILNVLGVVNGETTWSVKSVHDGTAPAAIGTSAAGTALTASHRDHVHATGAGTPANVGSANATGSGPAASMTDHVHNLPLLSPLAFSVNSLTMATGGHGATEHADVTRSFWVKAADMASNALDSGTLAASGTAPDVALNVQLADAATSGFSFDICMPDDAKVNSAVNAIILWAPTATDASSHAVRWSMDLLTLSAGVAFDATGTTTTWTGVSQANTLKQMVLDTSTQVSASQSAGDLIRGNLRRLGADAADTYVGNARVIAIRFTYTATQ